MSEYLLWLSCLVLLTGLATYGCCVLWETHVRRDEEEASAMLARHVAALREREEERRRAMEQQVLLTREVNHRAKNLLAVVQTVIRMTPTRDPEATAAITARLASLVRAHDLLVEREWRGADLRGVAEQEMRAYMTGQPPRVRLAGEVLRLGGGAVQPISIVLHELITNAARHGALSKGGRVDICWRREADRLRLRWRESDGPALEGPPRHRGFGTRVIDATVKGQLGGTIERQWLASGLVCDMTLPLTRIVEPEEQDSPLAA
jgi:two-component sensor histidine kinase